MTNKKKKKAAPAIQRGFATSSIASKPRHDPEDEKKILPKSANGVDANGKPTEEAPAPVAETENQLSPEELEAELEKSELQMYLEANGPKVAKESQRQMSKMLTDSRVLRAQSQPLSTSWITDELLEEILEAARQNQRLKSHSGPQKKQPEETWVNRFWALMKVLMEMGVSKERVFRLLETLPMQETAADGSNMWGLRQALDSLALDEGDLELKPYDKPATDTRDVLIGQEIESEPEKPKIIKQLVSSRPSSQGPTRPSSRGATPAPSEIATPYISGGEDDDFEVSDVDSDLEMDDLVQVYLSTKLKLFKLRPDLVDASSRKKATASRTSSVSRSGGIRKLRDKIRKIESDILFDCDAAHVKWMAEKINHLRTKAVDSGVETPSPTRELRKSLDLNRKSMEIPKIQFSNQSSPISTTQQEDDDILGGMFLEPQSVVTAVDQDDPSASGMTVTIRDFGKMAGYPPRRLLEDACKARDSHVKIIYSQISATTYSCRHSVTISWAKSQERAVDEGFDLISVTQKPSSRDKNRISAVTFSASTVATPDLQQSEAFVATVAAFVLFSQSPKEEKMYTKLGAAWRELWAELLDLRMAKRDAADREDIKLLRKLVHERVERDHADGFVLSDQLRNMGLAKNGVDATGPTRSWKEQQDANQYAKYLWEQRIFSQPYQYMLQFRNALPMAAFREKALNTIHDSQITILCGETGCGKSTQLPAFIMEDQFMRGHNCKVLCTEPRRISAISLAGRVSQELGEMANEVGTATSLVGYAVRLETHIGPYTRLIYATVGVVLRMVEDPNGLDEYTHLVIDEVHERSIETDFLLVILKNLLKRRPDLKVILMSATVDATRFSAYLDGAPIIDVPGRTFPVVTRFLEDAIEVTGATAKGHKRVQMQEDDDVDEAASGISAELLGYSLATRNALAEYDEYQINYHLIVNLMEAILVQPEFSPFRKAILVFLPGINEIRELNNMILNHSAFGSEVLIYPLHSSISSEEQQQAFVVPPEGYIKIVLATNIAETGVTIPDVTCVIDTGTHKEMRFDERKQLFRLVQSFISRANAKQRRGRAGRVQEGICFHLFTKKRHDDLMSNQQTPEMLRLSLQDLVMRVKICGLGNIEETLSQALDPPSSRNIRRAIDALIEVGALTTAEELTPLGRQLVKLPLDANLGKLVLLSAIFGCLDAGLTIASILSSKSPFVTPFGERDRADAARLAFSRGDSDLLTAYNAYCSWRRVLDTTINENVYVFCRRNYLSSTVLSNIEDLKSQLMSSLLDTGILKFLPASSKAQRTHHGYKSLLRVPPEADAHSANDIVTSTVIAWSFYPKLLLRDGKGWRSVSNSASLSLHPTSVNRYNHRPKYLSFYSIMQSGNKFHSMTNAQSTTVAHELPLVLLAGDAEVKMHAGVLAIDSNRLRFVVKDWKMAIALKTLRLKLEEVCEWAISGRPLTGELEWWKGVFVRICTRADKEH